MPKLNIYADNELWYRVKKMNLPISQICQQALWAAIEGEAAATCKECETPAVFHIKNDDGDVFACRRHLSLYITEGVSTVRAL